MTRERRRRSRSPRTVNALEQLPWRRVENHFRPMEVLGPEQIEMIHECSLQVLEELGVEMMNARALDLLENAVGNADEQGFDGESMTIMHVAAHKVGESPGRKPRAFGRASEWNTPEVDVELILEEAEETDAEEVGA